MDGNSPGKKKQRPTTGRAPNADGEKEKADSSIELEHVLGISVYSGSALTCHPMSGLVAYPAGCVLVLLDSVKNKQVATLHTPRKSITAASFSPDGRYVLTGESGLQPAVRVWDISR
ncbi:mitogen-activated protein kinase-binding protein 1, partial [Biomphalaria glabrata]